jgi:hypothetical protein
MDRADAERVARRICVIKGALEPFLARPKLSAHTVHPREVGESDRSRLGSIKVGVVRMCLRIHRGRRAGSGLEHPPRIKLSGQSHADALDPERVLPAVAIVLKVDQPVDAGIFNYRAQRCLAGIL